MCCLSIQFIFVSREYYTQKYIKITNLTVYIEVSEFRTWCLGPQRKIMSSVGLFSDAVCPSNMWKKSICTRIWEDK